MNVEGEEVSMATSVVHGSVGPKAQGNSYQSLSQNMQDFSLMSMLKGYQVNIPELRVIAFDFVPKSK